MRNVHKTRKTTAILERARLRLNCAHQSHLGN
jgi:hypothetical protein